MKRMSRWTWLPLAVFLAAPALAADDKKPNDPKKPEAEKKDEKKPEAPKPGADKKDDPKLPPPPKGAPDKNNDLKLPPPPRGSAPDKKEAEKKVVSGGVLSGEVSHVETAKNTFRVKVSYQYAEPNPGAIQGFINEQRAAAFARDPNARRQHLINMLNHQRNMYRPKTASRDFDIVPDEKCEVRLPAPKSTFDKDGKPMKLSPAEVAKLRGRDRLFAGEFSDLTTGQVVQVTIIKPKTAPAAKRDKDDVNFDDLQLKASRIVVVRQPLPPP